VSLLVDFTRPRLRPPPGWNIEGAAAEVIDGDGLFFFLSSLFQRAAVGSLMMMHSRPEILPASWWPAAKR
jgi:hypothetical protein